MDQSGYSFSSEPRAVKTKYRDGDDPASKNIHTDPRVARGSTYSTSTPLSTTVLERGNKTKKGKAAPRLKRKDIFSVKPDGHAFTPVPLEQYLIEKVVVVDTREESEQTDQFLPRPPVLDYYTHTIPKKRGIDATTQIEQEDNLFDFDFEVEPLLDVLIGKTMEMSLMEVEEEEEIRAIKERRVELMQDRHQEALANADVEKAANAQFEEKQRLVAEEKDRVAREQEVTSKVFASSFMHAIVAESKNIAFDEMERTGVFYDPDHKMVEEDFMPWLYEGVQAKYENRVKASEIVDSLLEKALYEQTILQNTHWLQHQAEIAVEACVEEPDPVPEEELPEGYIRIFLNGAEKLGLPPDQPIGPIAVDGRESLEEMEAKIQEWIRANLKEDFEPPAGGVLSFAKDGAALDRETSLFDQSITNNDALDIA
jgi:hypothetical protein